jgi:hypothetical protein
MKSFDQISRDWNEYQFKKETHKTNHIQTLKFIMINSNKDLVGRITISKHKDETCWMLNGVKSHEKGKGKILFYHAMSFIFPKYLTADEAGNSYNVMCMFKALKSVDYVQHDFIGLESWKKDSSGDWDLNIKCRFSFIK